MPLPRPLFVTGTARSGSTLLARLLTVNPRVMVASDPYLPLFRSLRNAIGRHARSQNPTLAFDPAAPFQDYYFTHQRLELLDAIQAGTLDVTFDQGEWPTLLDAIRARAVHECPDLLPMVDELVGPTYRDILERALAIIARARACSHRTWVGLKDLWIIELFQPLAKAFPEAKFIVLLRHPAATINSDLGALPSNPSGVGHPLSSSRQWRKHVALSTHYQHDPLFVGRLLVVRYEQLLAEPEQTCRDLCAFLEIGYDPAMVDTNRYFDFSTQTTWKGNSSFEGTVSGLSTHRAHHWRSILDPRIVEMTEFTCAYDMRLMGYAVDAGDKARAWPSPGILEYIIESGTRWWDWRTDLGDPQEDYGSELFRHALLELPTPPLDATLIRRCFLFEDVYATLRQAPPVSSTR